MSMIFYLFISSNQDAQFSLSNLDSFGNFLPLIFSFTLLFRAFWRFFHQSKLVFDKLNKTMYSGKKDFLSFEEVELIQVKPNYFSSHRYGLYFLTKHNSIQFLESTTKKESRSVALLVSKLIKCHLKVID